MNSISSDEWISFQWWNTVSNLFLILNSVLVFFILFVGRKRASSTWAWILILLFVPVFGLLLFLLFGLPHNKKKGRYSAVYINPEIRKFSQQQLAEIDGLSFTHLSPVSKEWQSLIRMNLRSGIAPLTSNNRIQIYTDGKRKFDRLFLDIEAAKHHIHLQYYILKDDRLGNHLLGLLTKKAKQGIKVLVLYDDIGSKSLPKKIFDELIQAGGRVAASLPSKIPFANPHINYRNHRKITVIDGTLGYIGGFNVGDEYLGGKGKYGYWRDTHLRIAGDAVHSLQHQFLTDWNHSTENHPVKYTESYFPKTDSYNGAAMQVLSSGPGESIDQIKNGFLQMIASAQHSVYIQTPYFIPDDAILNTIQTAALKGIDVRIMIPKKTDHLLVQKASLSFIGELLPIGVKVYSYDNGFLHAKTLLMDGKVCSTGSANLDIRSFSLNFEVNAFIYDEEATEEMVRIFFSDVRLSDEITVNDFESMSFLEHSKQRFARLIAPIL